MQNRGLPISTEGEGGGYGATDLLTTPTIMHMSTSHEAKTLTPQPGSSGQVQRRAYKIQEAAEILGVTPITVRRLINRGLIRPCRVLRHVLIPADEIEKLLND